MGLISGSKNEIEENTSRGLSKLYIVALAAVALLTILGQILVQRAISNQLADSHVVNLAGSQRYLSQQLAKTSMMIYSGLGKNTDEVRLADLKRLVRRWEQGHKGLQFGDKELGLPGKNSQQISLMFADTDPYFQNVITGAKTIIALAEAGKNPETMRDAVSLILDNESFFLKRMDDIVHQYDKEARERVTFLKKVESVLMVITLLILLLEGLFIFRPAAKKITHTIHELIESETKASALAEKLRMTNLTLEKSLKDLKDINVALEHATILAKTDSYGIITYVNDKFCEISGYSRHELLGNRFNMLSGHYHSRSFFDNMWEIISSGKIWNDEIKNKAKDGSFFWLDATIVPIMDENNIPIRYIAIYTDITQRFRQSINEQKIKSSFILEGQEKERRKIARELHDGIGQMLTALKFNFESIKGANTKTEKSRLEDLKKLISDTMQEVRRVSFNLMPSVLNDFGIIPAVKHLTEQVSKHSGIKILFENDFESERLNKTMEINLYRIIQEALNNAVKYAAADEVKINLCKNGGFLKLNISDNGKGFNTKSIHKDKLSGSGNGITNIQERTSLINGDFSIQTAPGEGTKIMINVPLK